MSFSKQDILKNLTAATNKSMSVSLSRKEILVPHIFVERSTCSIIAGIDETITEFKNYFSEYGIDYVLIETGCKGHCSCDPAVSIQLPGRTALSFKNVYFNKVSLILDSILNNILPDKSLILGQYPHHELNSWPDIPDIDEIPFFRMQKRNLTKYSGIIEPDSIESYITNGGYRSFAQIMSGKTPLEVCNIIESSGLRGRGGGGFYTGLKWKLALDNPAPKKYFICNADESDPGSFSGRMLIESNPHLLIEGVLIGAYAINASNAIIYTSNKYLLATNRLKNAIDQAAEAGLCGEDIFGSGVNIRLSVFEGPGAYVCGEETALIASIQGERANPIAKPPYPSESGLFGCPTIVNNVETVCNVPLIIKNGIDEFKESGSYISYGTKLYSIGGKADFPGTIEMELGKSVRNILDIVRLPENPFPIKAVHLGGPSGSFVHPDYFNEGLDYNTLSDGCLWLGSGSFTILDSANCIVDLTKYFVAFLNNESCGKCIPCREGTSRLLDILTKITEKPSLGQKHESLQRFKGVTQLTEISQVMKETSLCGLGQNAPESVVSGLKFFRQEYEEHIFERNCNASVCRNLKEYSVNIDNCVGCGLCAKRCPADAIIGSARMAHFIIQDKCIKCGICEQACKFDAIKVN
jgi:NADH:ubiquinone oxidoreductase subunit F (NADH-binding)/Pyruvate/2-oxoacid:ferredoxin oxidoreductase delta subunit